MMETRQKEHAVRKVEDVSAAGRGMWLVCTLTQEELGRLLVVFPPRPSHDTVHHPSSHA
jgi:hypothetical protein